jgi:hypothetical protein
LVNKRVITPADGEVQLNPRSRSARLRAAERIIEWNGQTEMTNGNGPGFTGMPRFSDN